LIAYDAPIPGDVQRRMAQKIAMGLGAGLIEAEFWDDEGQGTKDDTGRTLSRHLDGNGVG